MNTPDAKPLTQQALDEQIRVLESQLAQLRLERRTRFGSQKDWEMGDPFLVHSADEFTLDALPDLARAILDALPVSVFIKHADVSQNLGRRFTYVNAPARHMMPDGPWTELEVRDKHDSKAFPEGFNSVEYQNMLDQETETLNGKVSRRTTLTWKHKEGRYRNTITFEIPIFRRGDNGVEANPVGFCAIAQEELPKQIPIVQSWLHRVFLHEFRGINACATAHSLRAKRVTKINATLTA